MVTNINGLKDIMARNSNLALYALTLTEICVDKFRANWIVLIATFYQKTISMVGTIIDSPASYDFNCSIFCKGKLYGISSSKIC